MKTISCAQCRKKIEQEQLELHRKDQYSIYKALAHTFACYSTAAVLMAFIRRGRSKQYIKQLFDDMVFIFDTPQLFGNDINLPDVMEKLSKEYDIDFKRINVNIETEKQFITGKH